MAVQTLATWDEILQAERGKIFYDAFEDRVRFIVMRGGASLCAYLGIPEDHPLANHSYDDLPVRAHGGLTFGEKGNGNPHPTGYFWYGWDYGHLGDCVFYDHGFRKSNDKKWDVEAVIADSREAQYDFNHLVRLAESIARKAIQ